MEEALEIFKQPKQFRGRGAPKPPLASWPNPAGGPDIVLKEGRFGLYVTDGETNASLRKGDEPSDLNAERVVELLVQRREYMASPEGQERAARRGQKKAKKAKAPKAAKGAKAAVPEAAEKPAKKPVAKKAPAAKKEKAAPAKAAVAAKKKPAPKKKAGDKKPRSAS
jgi:DNA topoisomerase-1